MCVYQISFNRHIIKRNIQKRKINEKKLNENNLILMFDKFSNVSLNQFNTMNVNQNSCTYPNSSQDIYQEIKQYP
jgi:hypothetical protein